MKEILIVCAVSKIYLTDCVLFPLFDKSGWRWSWCNCGRAALQGGV